MDYSNKIMWGIWISLASVCIFTALDTDSKIQEVEKHEANMAEPIFIEPVVDEAQIPIKPIVKNDSKPICDELGNCPPANNPVYRRQGLFRWRLVK